MPPVTCIVSSKEFLVVLTAVLIVESFSQTAGGICVP
ncbi:MAG: hypothetical protein A4E60_00134 [Syntrophorhabdus sp. PtaB.Bin047]|nr:MAG: hypothetical protein A4E60_00134 [Syntrophorhabdus sp. PtaB.Bin047]